jgi:hypothetical protein
VVLCKFGQLKLRHQYLVEDEYQTQNGLEKGEFEVKEDEPSAESVPLEQSQPLGLAVLVSPY